MARQKGIIKLSGSLGETTFYDSKDGAFAHLKVDITEKRRKTAPEYANTRRNAAEFGNASNAVKLIKNSIGQLVNIAHDYKLNSRLTSLMTKVVDKDVTPNREHQVVRGENLGLLLGFNFNIKVRLRVAFNVPFTTNINRTTGEVTIAIASFRPSTAIRAPKQATHVSIMSGASEIYFPTKDLRQRNEIYSQPIILDDTFTQEMTIVHFLKPGTTGTIIIALGLDFSEAKGNFYSSAEQKQPVNPLCIVDFDKGDLEPVETVYSK